MSLNLTCAGALRTIVVVGLLLALVCAMLGSIGLSGHSFYVPDSAGAPEVPSEPLRGANVGTNVPTTITVPR